MVPNNNRNNNPYMSYSVNFLEGDYIGGYMGDHYRGYQADARSSDDGSYHPHICPCNPYIQSPTHP